MGGLLLHRIFIGVDYDPNAPEPIEVDYWLTEDNSSVLQENGDKIKLQNNG